MPADEVTHAADAGASRVRTGPRHAAPKKPLFTRFHMPTGKVFALAAMPTAVLMGMGFTPTLAVADGNDPAATSKSLTAEEYKACVEAMEGDEDDKGDASASATPSPSASESSTEGTGSTDSGTDGDSSSSSDSGSDDKGDDTAGDDTEPEPSASASPSTSASASASTEKSVEKSEEAAASPSPSASESGGLLEGIGDAIEDFFTGGKGAEESASASASAAPSPSASASASAAAPEGDGSAEDTGAANEEDAEDGSGSDGAADAPAADADDPTASPDADAGASGSPTPTPSASASDEDDADADATAEDCPVATDDVGGVDNTLALPNEPWELEASSLTLKGASYKGIVEVRTASGATKKVLKYVISSGTDIGDLHQIVKDDTTGKTHHVQAAEGSTSTIRDGDTVMYTESISGNLLGLIPITFDPENPPPLDIPLIYFTKVKVVQAGQFGGTLTVPGLHQYITD
ncbi:hypothetical protein [Streptomyces sp. CRN 30]|uniref:hypothetical protein n=1 Tax=Streptomyces sp. CRN 30 TaxID=3075613 RepID=UPI002A806439|nr:hypothetical protein [Streptomyces sp. CRN 30]